METVRETKSCISRIDTNNFGFWSYDLFNHQLWVSKEVKRILSLNIEISKPTDFLYSIIDPASLDLYHSFCEEVFILKRNKSIELKVSIRDSPKWISVKASFNSESQLINGIIEEITAFKENQLIEISKIGLGDTIERITNTGSFEWNLSEESLTCSDNFFTIAQIQGHNVNNQLSKSIFLSIIEERKQNFVLDIMHECVTFNQEFEVVFHTSSSKRRKIKIYGHPEGDLHNKRLIGIIVDITNETNGQESVIRAQDAERKRISLELHDSVGQKLVAIKYMLALFQISKDKSQLGELNKSIDEIIDEIRSITHNLSTQIVKEVGLKNAVSQLLNECAKAMKAKKSLNFYLPQNVTISDEMAKMIYRIVQEALSNSMKYSEAKELDVSFKYQNKQVVINIIDNGIGFNLNELRTDGIGLQNIRQRVSYLNGFLRIESKTDQGTNIKIKIPY